MIWAVIVMGQNTATILHLTSDRDEANRAARAARREYEGQVQIVKVEHFFLESDEFVVTTRNTLWKKLGQVMPNNFREANRVYKALIQ